MTFRSALVTGGRSGIGAAIVSALEREGEDASPDELRDFLAPSFAKWWLPDRFEFVDEIPKTAVGKFRKTALREQFATEPQTAETA